MARVDPGGFLALRQTFTGGWIQILAESQEVLSLNSVPQAELFRTQSLPLAKGLVILTVVISDPQMLIKIGFRVDQIRLCFAREHGANRSAT